MLLNNLSQLSEGTSGIVVRLSPAVSGRDQQDAYLESWIERIRTLGLVEGKRVQVMKRAPFFADPIQVECEGIYLALRIEEAKLVWVQEK